MKTGKHSSKCEVSSPRKRKRLTKERDQKKRKGDLQMRGRRQFFTPTTSSVRETFAEPRQQPGLVTLLAASESTFLSSYPIYMSKTQVCSALSDPSEWLRIGGKVVRLQRNFFQLKTPRAALSCSESCEDVFFLFVHVNTGDVLSPRSVITAVTLAVCPCKATLIQQQTCCEVDPIEP